MTTYNTLAARAARRQFVKYAKTTRSGSWVDFGTLCINYVTANFTYDAQLWETFRQLMNQVGERHLHNTNA